MTDHLQQRIFAAQSLPEAKASWFEFVLKASSLRHFSAGLPPYSAETGSSSLTTTLRAGSTYGPAVRLRLRPTPLRQQIHNAMLVRGLAERTRQTYIEAVARLAILYHQNPADPAPE